MTARKAKPAQKKTRTKKTRTKKKAAKKTGPSRRIFSFGSGKADGGASMKSLLGGKGANLAEMSRLGIPVPPGFTISTQVCSEYIGICV